MIRSILTGVVTAAIFWAPAILADEISDGIAHAGTCAALADAAGLTDARDKWVEYGGAVAGRSGLSDFNKGYWVGVGTGSGYQIANSLGGNPKEIFKAYAQICLGGGQQS